MLIKAFYKESLVLFRSMKFNGITKLKSVNILQSSRVLLSPSSLLMHVRLFVPSTFTMNLSFFIICLDSARLINLWSMQRSHYRFKFFMFQSAQSALNILKADSCDLGFSFYADVSVVGSIDSKKFTKSRYGSRFKSFYQHTFGSVLVVSFRSRQGK